MDIIISTIVDLNSAKKTILSIKKAKQFSKHFLTVVVQKYKINNTTRNKNQQIIYSNTEGLGKSKQIALQNTQNSIIAYTDDDCIVHESWLIEIEKYFKQNPDVDIVFGKTLPPRKKKQNEFIVCNFNPSDTPYITTELSAHWEKIGFGNNMAIRRSLLEDIGLPKWWLGTGSIAQGGVDAEFIIRALKHKKKIGYNPKMIIYHNRFLSENEYKQKNSGYTCGGIASYGYHYLRGYKECYPILKAHCLYSFSIIKKEFKNFLRGNTSSINSAVRESTALIRGSSIALFFSIVDSLFQLIKR